MTASGMEPVRPTDTGTDPRDGLDPLEAAERLRRYGPNALPESPRERWPMRLLRQFREPMAILLIVAAAVSGLGLREPIDALAIMAIAILNALIGLAQEGRATRALEALHRMETPTARVVRGGRAVPVPAPDIVPGDVVVLAAGDRVPADMDVVEGSSLEVDESMLSGESLPVPKDSSAHARPGAGVTDQPGMAFSGTLVTRGSGRGIVLATGPDTEMGRIASHLRDRQPRTPLQLELASLTARLGTIAVLVAVAVFGLTLLRTGLGGGGLERSFLAAVALAVAAVPEGLATVVTVALALGVRRMAARGAIVRRLPAVETLGSTTVILTDKTGTLTRNRMGLDSVAVPGASPVPLSSLAPAARTPIVEAAVLCNDGSLTPPNGDAADVALLEAVGTEAVEAIRGAYPRVADLPFESERRRMTTAHRMGEHVLVLVKGAPEVLVDRCVHAFDPDDGHRPLTVGLREEILRLADEMAGGGMRMLALARAVVDEVPPSLEEAERDLTLLALVGLRDPLREEARDAVAEARSAGVRIVMVTGDHVGTATAVAEEAGVTQGGGVLTGAELRGRGLPSDPLETSVYARVDPDQKLSLVESLRDGGQVVAVTGDGVNDAPALRRADIGVAMGASGSDVAREAADLVVTDDNLATIVTAVREGRGIYDNVRKVVDYLVGGNLSEITVVVAALILFPALGVPLLPLQLLWVNLLTDGLPAIALGVDPVDPALMRRPPRPRDHRLLGGRHVIRLAVRGLLIAGSTVGALAIARFGWGEPWSHARAVMFSVLVTAHLLYAFVARLPSRGLNRWLLVAVAGGLLLQALIVWWPAAHPVFHTAPLTAREWALVAAAGVLPVGAMLLLPRSVR